MKGNNNTVIVLVVIVLGLLIGIGGYVIFTKDKTNSSTTPQEISPNTTTTDTGNSISETTVSMAEVQKHHTIEDCYVVIEGSVYSIPKSFIQSHNGGTMPFKKGCGGDITTEFNQVHGRSKKVKNMLQGYFLGNLG